MWTDCHTHLDQYAPAELPGILKRAQAAGVGLIIVAGTTLDSSRRAQELARRHPLLYAGIGLHPMDLSRPLDDATLQRLHDLAADPKVVTVSEVGLDFMPGTPDRPTQEHAFRVQVRLAREMNLPIIFHSRNSHPEVLRLLREEHADDVGGAWHYFQGDLTLAQQAMDLGFCVSLAKPLLRLPELQETARHIPLQYVVLETDAAPQPWKKDRQSWTEPHHVRLVAEKLAELHGVALAEIESITAANLGRLLKGRVAALPG